MNIQTLQAIRAVIEKKPQDFEAYQDYFDMLRALGKEDKTKSYEHNLWLRIETAKMVRAVTDVGVMGKFFNLNKRVISTPHGTYSRTT